MKGLEDLKDHPKRTTAPYEVCRAGSIHCISSCRIHPSPSADSLRLSAATSSSSPPPSPSPSPAPSPATPSSSDRQAGAAAANAPPAAPPPPSAASDSCRCSARATLSERALVGTGRDRVLPVSRAGSPSIDGTDSWGSLDGSATGASGGRTKRRGLFLQNARWRSGKLHAVPDAGSG